MGIDGDWERGRVWFRTEDRVITIYRRTNNSSSGSGVRGFRRWTGQISGNRRYRRRHGVLVSICVACILAAPPLTKNGACSKPAKAFAKIPARSGERSLLVNSMHARIHIVERRIGHRDDRGTLGVCNASMLGAAKPGDSGRS